MHPSDAASQEGKLDFKPFKIGKYLLLEKLATGGMAEVYRAKASGAGGFEKQLAIKRILPHYASNEEFRRMFEYEARLSSMLTHANIVQIYDFVKSNETYLLAMEYVDGKNLRQVVNKARKMKITVPIEFAAYAIIEVCKGLDYAHKKKEDLTGRLLNIIHRDMSPQNIMLSYEGAVKIVDFGIAKAKDRVDETRSGVIKGKFGYMSPEQANGEAVTHRTDIFSTGIILYELLTNSRLFTAENDMATLRMIQECAIPLPSRVNPKVSSDLEKIVLKALTKDTKLRYQDAGTFARNLQDFMNKHHPSYHQREAAEFIQRILTEEIVTEKKRYEQLHRQSIPFSQGENSAVRDISQIIDGLEDEENTESEADVQTPVTFVEEEPSDNEISSQQTPESVGVSKSSEFVAPPKSLDDKSLSTPSINLSDDPIEEKDVPSMQDVKTILADSSVTEQGSAPSDNTENEVTPSTDRVLAQKSTTPISLEPPSVGSLSLKPEDQSKTTRSSVSSMPYSPPYRYKPSRKAPTFSQKMSTSVSVALLFLVIIGTGYFYQLYMGGKVPELISRFIVSVPEPVIDAPSRKTTMPVERKIGGDCLLRVESDPPGAKVIVGSEVRGITPIGISSPCQQPIDLSLRLENYESVSENIVPRNQNERIFRSLKRVPQGTLEITLAQNARVYVDGTLVGELTAGRPHEFLLRAGRKHTFQFVNETLGINVRREFVVEEGSRSKLSRLQLMTPRR